MRFIHMADVQLGCIPDGRSEWGAKRASELWETFRDALEDASRMKADLVLIAGDLFHNPPGINELRELNYLFRSYPDLCFALIAGNHDCAYEGSAWLDFEFARNVAFLSDSRCECVRFPGLGCEIYGFSYDRREIPEARYDQIRPDENDYFHILLAHGGDASHIPIRPQALRDSGFDYIALGHIHKPTVLIPEKAIYSGALSPIDAGDEGPHGYIFAETFGHSVRTEFIRKAPREYVTLTVEAAEEDTFLAIRDRAAEAVKERGEENIYRLVISGQRDPGMYIDKETLLGCGMVLDVTDRTVPAFHMEELKERFRGQLIGRYIESFEGRKTEEVQQKALQYGLEALLGSMKD